MILVCALLFICTLCAQALIEAVDAMRGMNITITTTAKTDAEAKALLAAFHFPFKN